jgi:Ca2+-binding EF-hand superfamily protein/RNA-binding protein YhbY
MVSRLLAFVSIRILVRRWTNLITVQPQLNLNIVLALLWMGLVIVPRDYVEGGGGLWNSTKAVTSGLLFDPDNGQGSLFYDGYSKQPIRWLGINMRIDLLYFIAIVGTSLLSLVAILRSMGEKLDAVAQGNAKLTVNLDPNAHGTASILGRYTFGRSIEGNEENMRQRLRKRLDQWLQSYAEDKQMREIEKHWFKRILYDSRLLAGFSATVVLIIGYVLILSWILISEDTFKISFSIGGAEASIKLAFISELLITILDELMPNLIALIVKSENHIRHNSELATLLQRIFFTKIVQLGVILYSVAKVSSAAEGSLYATESSGTKCPEAEFGDIFLKLLFADALLTIVLNYWDLYSVNHGLPRLNYWHTVHRFQHQADKKRMAMLNTGIRSCWRQSHTFDSSISGEVAGTGWDIRWVKAESSQKSKQNGQSDLVAGAYWFVKGDEDIDDAAKENDSRKRHMPREVKEALSRTYRLQKRILPPAPMTMIQRLRREEPGVAKVQWWKRRKNAKSTARIQQQQSDGAQHDANLVHNWSTGVSMQKLTGSKLPLGVCARMLVDAGYKSKKDIVKSNLNPQELADIMWRQRGKHVYKFKNSKEVKKARREHFVKVRAERTPETTPKLDIRVEAFMDMDIKTDMVEDDLTELALESSGEEEQEDTTELDLRNQVLRGVFDLYDLDHTDALDSEEVENLLHHLHLLHMDALCKQAQKLSDEHPQSQELRDKHRKAEAKLEERLTEKEIREFIAAMQKTESEDGLVDFEELKAWWDDDNNAAALLLEQQLDYQHQQEDDMKEAAEKNADRSGRYFLVLEHGVLSYYKTEEPRAMFASHWKKKYSRHLMKISSMRKGKRRPEDIMKDSTGMDPDDTLDQSELAELLNEMSPLRIKPHKRQVHRAMTEMCAGRPDKKRWASVDAFETWWIANGGTWVVKQAASGILHMAQCKRVQPIQAGGSRGVPKYRVIAKKVRLQTESGEPRHCRLSDSIVHKIDQACLTNSESESALESTSREGRSSVDIADYDATFGDLDDENDPAKASSQTSPDARRNTIARVNANDSDVHTVNWSEVGVDDGELKSLATALDGNPHVRKIDIRYNCRLTDDAAKELLLALSKCQVTKVDMRGESAVLYKDDIVFAERSDTTAGERRIRREKGGWIPMNRKGKVALQLLEPRDSCKQIRVESSRRVLTLRPIVNSTEEMALESGEHSWLQLLQGWITPNFMPNWGLRLQKVTDGAQNGRHTMSRKRLLRLAEEHVSTGHTYATGPRTTLIRDVFDEFDADGSGVLTEDELKEMLQKLHRSRLESEREHEWSKVHAKAAANAQNKALAKEVEALREHYQAHPIADDKLSEHDLQRHIKKMQHRGSNTGSVDFDAFMLWWNAKDKGAVRMFRNLWEARHMHASIEYSKAIDIYNQLLVPIKDGMAIQTSAMSTYDASTKLNLPDPDDVGPAEALGAHTTASSRKLTNHGSLRHAQAVKSARGSALLGSTEQTAESGTGIAQDNRSDKEILSDWKKNRMKFTKRTLAGSLDYDDQEMMKGLEVLLTRKHVLQLCKDGEDALTEHTRKRDFRGQMVEGRKKVDRPAALIAYEAALAEDETNVHIHRKCTLLAQHVNHTSSKLTKEQILDFTTNLVKHEGEWEEVTAEVNHQRFWKAGTKKLGAQISSDLLTSMLYRQSLIWVSSWPSNLVYPLYHRVAQLI